MSKHPYVTEEQEALIEKGPDGDRQNLSISQSRLKVNKYYRLLVVLLCSSVALNCFVLFKFYSIQSHRDIGRSRYSGLGFDFPVKYQTETDYTSENDTLANELWEAIDTSPMAIAPNKTWARHRKLPESDDFPWDNEKANYFVKVFHQLHCLKLLRRYIVDHRDGKESVIKWEHCQHCLDSLRKDVMCMADDTPVYAKTGKRLGDGQVMWCRNFDKLVEWTQDLERNACYETIDDYKTIVHSLERYAFCPKDSPYYKVQHDYFEKWGHKNPWKE